MRILWDDPKRLANINKHGLDFVLVDLDFFATALVVPAAKDPFKAVGRLGGAGMFVAVFAPVSAEAVSIISLRPASRKEKEYFDGETA